MKVLLLGATGNLGRHILPSLIAHHHTPILLLRDPSKLPHLFSSSLLSLIPPENIYTGDATDSPLVKKILIEQEIENLICVAGNQVLPWKEYALPKIVGSVSKAGIEVGRERERVIRAWFMGGMGLLNIPNDKKGRRIEDFMPKRAGAQHHETYEVLLPIPITSLEWSLLAIGLMIPRTSPLPIQLLPSNPSTPLANPSSSNTLPSAPRHNLLVKADELPEWEENTTWLVWIPWIGMLLNILWCWGKGGYLTKYVDVAEFMVGDLDEHGDSEWVGRAVGVKEVGRGKVKSS